MIAKNDPAIIKGKLVACWPLSCANPADNVILSFDVLTINGHSNEFHPYNIANIERDINADLESGKITVKNIFILEAPSQIAASSNSSGIVIKNWRNKKVPKAENNPGKNNAGMLSNNPNFWTIKYCGIKKTCPGTINTDNIKINKVFLNGKSNLANAYAAIEQKRSEERL